MRRRSPHPVTNLLMRLSPLVAAGALIAAVVTGAGAIVQPLLLVTVLLAPVLLPRRMLYPPEGGSSTEDSDEEGGGGRGPRPRPSKPPDTPWGGLPLPDARPARVRLRDHGRRGLTPRRPRRTVREPERVPQRHHASLGAQR